MTTSERIDQLIAELHGKEDIPELPLAICDLLYIPQVHLHPNRINVVHPNRHGHGPPKCDVIVFMHRIYNQGFDSHDSDDEGSSDDEEVVVIEHKIGESDLFGNQTKYGLLSGSHMHLWRMAVKDMSTDFGYYCRLIKKEAWIRWPARQIGGQIHNGPDRRPELFAIIRALSIKMADDKTGEIDWARVADASITESRTNDDIPILCTILQLYDGHSDYRSEDWQEFRKHLYRDLNLWTWRNMIIDNKEFDIPKTERARQYMKSQHVRFHLCRPSEGLQEILTKPCRKRNRVNISGEASVRARISNGKIVV